MGRVVAILAVAFLLSLAAPRAVSAQAGGPVVYNDRVLEITPEVVGRLVVALGAENQARKAATAAPAVAPKSEAEYQACALEALQSEAYMELLERIAEMADNAEEAAKAGKEMESFLVDRCGPSPYESASEPDDWAFVKAGLEAGAFTDEQYAVLKERALPFCALVTRPAADGGGVVRIPSEGYSNIFYVYGAGEVDVLTTRCAELLPALGPR